MGKYSDLEAIVRRQSEDIRNLKMGMKELLEERERLWGAIKLLAKETDAYKSWKGKDGKESGSDGNAV